jgi:NADH dehydrogenase [ubiquinone] 1 alpha subcomplex assembly factor 1
MFSFQKGICMIISILTFLLSLTQLGINGMSEEKILYDFSDKKSSSEWTIVNDGVMGGLSQSKMKIFDDETAVFNGVVSLENNGGFASVRTVPKNYELNDYDGIILKVKGDGLKYKFRIRTTNNWDGIAYSANFNTIENEWIEVKIPFEEFTPQFRGRILADVDKINPADIKQLGILIADYQKGEFNLIIDWIKGYKN